MVPATFTGSTLVKIETSFGAADSSQATTFRLRSIDSNGALGAHDSWTHPANTHQYTVTGLNLSTLHGKSVYIECTGGGAEANGYTATLMWQL